MPFESFRLAVAFCALPPLLLHFHSCWFSPFFFPFIHTPFFLSLSLSQIRDDVPTRTKNRRLAEVIDTFHRIAAEKNHAEAGKRHLVLVDGVLVLFFFYLSALFASILFSCPIILGLSSHSLFPSSSHSLRLSLIVKDQQEIFNWMGWTKWRKQKSCLPVHSNARSATSKRFSFHHGFVRANVLSLSFSLQSLSASIPFCILRSLLFSFHPHW